MDLEKARGILALPQQFNEADAKRQYHRLILQYHPDKSGNPGDAERFGEIKDAYTWLVENFDYGAPACGASYSDYVKEFLGVMLGPDGKKILRDQLARALQDEKKMEAMIEALPDGLVLKCYSFLNEYRGLLGVAQGAMNALEKVMKRREVAVEIVRPELDDLFVSNVVRLDVGGKPHFVPSWHSEITFEKGDGELVVKCMPKLPPHVSIDHDNNIYFHVKTSVSSLLERQTLKVQICGRTYAIPSHKLRVSRYQTWRFVSQGIARINEEDIYDDSVKGDVVLHIELTQ